MTDFSNEGQQQGEERPVQNPRDGNSAHGQAWFHGAEGTQAQVNFEAGGAANSEPLLLQNTFKGESSSRVEGMAVDVEAPTLDEQNRANGGNAAPAPLLQTRPGDKPAGEDANLDGVDQNASQRYRDKYAEVMRTFHSGRLRSQLSHVVKERVEARAIAADQAGQIDASPEQRVVR